MFVRVFALLPLALLVSVAAAPPPPACPPPGPCSTGSPTCCNRAVQGQDPTVNATLTGFSLGGLLDDITARVDALVGLDCSSIIGTGADCSQQPLCCEQTFKGGLINIGCVPITIKL